MAEDAPGWSTRRLDRGTDVVEMDCGDEPWGQSVTDFLVNDALEQQEWLGSRTTLFYYDGKLVGYVTLAATVLELRQAQQVARQPGIEELRRDLIPSVLIARFGVHKSHQRKGFGRRIFDWTLAEVIQSSIAARLLILHVDRENTGGRKFWQACGFRSGSGGKNILMWLDLYPFVANG
jgi:GNAT superfamily N-acetyltransferase